MSDRVLLCMWELSIKLLSKKSSWRADVVMRWPEAIYQEVNESSLTDHLIKYREREGERTSTINFKAFFCLCLYILFNCNFINKSELTE